MYMLTEVDLARTLSYPSRTCCDIQHQNRPVQDFAVDEQPLSVPDQRGKNAERSRLSASAFSHGFRQDLALE